MEERGQKLQTPGVWWKVTLMLQIKNSPSECLFQDLSLDLFLGPHKPLLLKLRMAIALFDQREGARILISSIL